MKKYVNIYLNKVLPFFISITYRDFFLSSINNYNNINFIFQLKNPMTLPNLLI